MSEPTDPTAPEVLAALVAGVPDLGTVVSWTATVHRLEQEGRITFPLERVADVRPIVRAMRGVGIDEDEGDDVVRCVPPVVFPIVDLADFARKGLLVLRIHHELIAPTRRKLNR